MVDAVMHKSQISCMTMHQVKTASNLALSKSRLEVSVADKFEVLRLEEYGVMMMGVVPLLAVVLIGEMAVTGPEDIPLSLKIDIFVFVATSHAFYDLLLLHCAQREAS